MHSTIKSKRDLKPVGVLLMILFFLTSGADGDYASTFSANSNKVQASEPSDISGLKEVSLSQDGTKLTLSWKPNPKSDAVLEYAVYGSYLQNTDKREHGFLIGITRKTNYVVTLTTGGNLNKGMPFSITQGKGHGSNFWVVAHNAYSWGENDVGTRNPDGRWSFGLTKAPHMGPTYLYVEFPCTAQGKKDHVCFH